MPAGLPADDVGGEALLHLGEGAVLGVQAQAEGSARGANIDVHDLAGQVQRAFLVALGRPPKPGEVEASARLVDDHGLAMLCRVLLNSNEFLFMP